MRDSVHKFVQDVLRVQSELGHFPDRKEYERLGKYGASIALLFGNWGGVERAVRREKEHVEEARTPKILIFDIETCLLRARIFSPKTEYVRHGQLDPDAKMWSVVAWAAKWYRSPEVFYKDQRHAKNIRDDKELLKPLFKLLDQADMVITKNGKRFDKKILNARFAINKMGQPSPYAHEDIEQLFRQHFYLPYYNQHYLCELFETKHRKLDHGKFPGQNLWDEIELGNLEAWEEMERYNRNDVLGSEELREIIAPYGSPGINFNLMHGDAVYRCEVCGSTHLQSRGTSVTRTGKFKRFQCLDCGAWGQSKGAGNNLFSLKKKMSLKGPG